mgnify:CR=1 FL=1
MWICLIALLALSCSQREGLDGSCGYLTIGLESEVEGDILVRSAEDESEVDPMIYRIQVVDAEEHPELTDAYGIMQAPTLVIVNNGEVQKFVNASNIKKYVDSKR